MTDLNSLRQIAYNHLEDVVENGKPFEDLPLYEIRKCAKIREVKHYNQEIKLYDEVLITEERHEVALSDTMLLVFRAVSKSDETCTRHSFELSQIIEY